MQYTQPGTLHGSPLQMLTEIVAVLASTGAILSRT